MDLYELWRSMKEYVSFFSGTAGFSVVDYVVAFGADSCFLRLAACLRKI